MCCCRLCFFFFHINGKQLSLIAQHSNFFHLSFTSRTHGTYWLLLWIEIRLWPLFEEGNSKNLLFNNFFWKKMQSYQATMSQHLINSNNKANAQNNDFCPIIVLRDTCLNILHLFAVYNMRAFLYIERDRNTNSIQTTRYSLISHE